MKVKTRRKAHRSDGLEVRRICGYTAVRPRSGEKRNANGWLYLRKHSDTDLFIGNMPQPGWFSMDRLGRDVSQEDLQERMKMVVRRMVPGAETIGDIFSTGNGQLATRIVMENGEKGVEEVLDKPEDHLYVNWDELRHGVDSGEDAKKESVVDRWLREYDEARDETAVSAWSNAVMKSFEVREKQKAEEQERREKQGAIPDDDGFITVTHGAKQMKAADAQKIGIKGKIGKGHYKSKGSRNRKTLLDTSKGIEKAGFYRWQRENKSSLVELQKKFKEDQKRIAAIRALRNEND